MTETPTGRAPENQPPDSTPDPDSTAEDATIRPRKSPPQRYRTSINLAARDHEQFKRMCAYEHTNFQEQVRRSGATRWHILSALRPEIAFPHLVGTPDLPPPSYLALHRTERDGSVTVTRLDIL